MRKEKEVLGIFLYFASKIKDIFRNNDFYIYIYIGLCDVMKSEERPTTK